MMQQAMQTSMPLQPWMMPPQPPPGMGWDAGMPPGPPMVPQMMGMDGPPMMMQPPQFLPYQPQFEANPGKA